MLLVKDEEAERGKVIAAIWLRQFVAFYGGLRRVIQWIVSRYRYFKASRAGTEALQDRSWR